MKPPLHLSIYHCKVDFQQGRLTISGERHFKNEQNGRRYHIVESSYGSFQRSFQLLNTVEPHQIQTQFEDGILRVMVPKNEEKTMRHQIQMQGGQSNSHRQRPDVGAHGRAGHRRASAERQWRRPEQQWRPGSSAPRANRLVMA